MLLLPLLLLTTFHIDFATFLGGSMDDLASGIAVDSLGNIYVSGTTNSPNFPLTSTALGTPPKAGGCAFVTKLDPVANSILWSVCLANLTSDAVALDGAGDVFLLVHDSGGVSSVIKLPPGADRLVYSKSLGTHASALAADAFGNAYAVGSTNQSLATTIGAYQLNLAAGTCDAGAGAGQAGPCTDAFAIKLYPDGSVAYVTFLGGSGPDTARAVAVDSQGNAWITGDTASSNFPTTPAAQQASFHGELDLGPLKFGDAFVAKLDAKGSKLLYSTYLGGSAADAGLAIAVDSGGNAYVAGVTQSSDFFTTPGALESTYAGVGPNVPPALSGSAFVTKFTTAGSLVYSTFAPGAAASQVAVDAQGDVYITGAGLSVIGPDGSTLLHSVKDAVPGGALIALDPEGSVYSAAASLEYPFFPSEITIQSMFGGGIFDVAVTKFDFTLPPSVFVSALLNAASYRPGTPQNYSVFDVAPGEIISVFGAGFDSTTRLLFDGAPAPILYVQANQINAVVPFEVAGPTTAITVQGRGQVFGPDKANVLETVPALFSLDGTGRGQAAALNQDGSLNSPSNPAPRGSVISVFMTGAGRLTPSPANGSLNPLAPPFSSVNLGVSSNIGQVTFAGGAPGLVAGAVQVNVQVSQAVAPSSKVPIVIYIGNYASGFIGDVTVAVR